MTVVIAVIAGVVALAGGLAGGFFWGSSHRKKVAEAQIGSAETEAKRILDDAMRAAEEKRKEAEAKEKEILLEGNRAAQKVMADAEKENRERRADIQRQERRLQQREDALDRKTDNIEAKEEKLAARSAEIEQRLEEAETLKKSRFDMLEKVSGYTADQAKQEIMRELDGELEHDKAVRIRDFEEQGREDIERRAKDILAQSIQRCAADHSAEITVSVVPLANDDMKGRIIGREGRNIRALEAATGVDFVIDDTPEAITLSAFDPVRREVARVALEKLMTDGRIHPGRIEETVSRAKAEVEQTIKEAGEKAVLDSGVRNLHPDLVKLLGRLRYRTSYGQNVLNHSLEVCYLTGLMAGELGEDVQLARRAGLLHDIGKALDHEQQQEGSHIKLGVDVAKKYKESEVVVNAIEAHHGEVPAKTVIAFLVQAADAISAARPGARRENIENYIKRLEKLEEIATSAGGVESAYAIQAGREVRILVRPDEVSDDQMALLARDVARRIEQELQYPGQIKVNVIRENRAVEYAK